MNAPIRVTLVSCSRTKASERKQAQALYTSPLFKLSLAHALQQAADGPVFILSAKHGALALDEVVEPYDLSMGDLGAVLREAWGQRVIKQVDGLLAFQGVTFDEPVDLVVYAGRLYVEPLRAAMPHGWTIAEPLAGLEIGQRLAFLSNSLKAA